MLCPFEEEEKIAKREKDESIGAKRKSNEKDLI